MNRRRLITTAALVVAAAFWAGTVAAAYRAIRLFESTPGPSANAPAAWPAKSVIDRAASEWSLVMLVHPHCSCSRASVDELQAVLEKAPATLRTYVLVYRPADFEPGWEKTQVVENAAKLRRAKVLIDENGAEADLFGGFTSGQTLVYDDRGRLRFAGGITSLRGHAGINSGRTGIIDILRSGSGSGTHPVFGCAISTKERKSS
jgi:hypothetical protein